MNLVLYNLTYSSSLNIPLFCAFFSNTPDTDGICLNSMKKLFLEKHSQQFICKQRTVSFLWNYTRAKSRVEIIKIKSLSRTIHFYFYIYIFYNNIFCSTKMWEFFSRLSFQWFFLWTFRTVVTATSTLSIEN